MNATTPRLAEQRLAALAGSSAADPAGPTADIFFLTPDNQEPTSSDR